MKALLEKKSFMISILVVIFIMIAVIIYCLFFTKTYGPIVYNDYTILEGHTGKIEEYNSAYAVEGYKGDGKTAYYINGKITANSSKQFTIITFNLYDKNNKLLGTAVTGLNEIKKNKVYDFKALSLVTSKDVKRIDHYKLKDIKNMEVK